MNWAVLREMNLAARELSNNKALDPELSELDKKTGRNREKLAGKHAKLKKELKLGSERIARVEGDLRADRTSQGSKRRAVKKGGSNNRGGSVKSSHSSGVGSPASDFRK